MGISNALTGNYIVTTITSNCLIETERNLRVGLMKIALSYTLSTQDPQDLVSQSNSSLKILKQIKSSAFIVGY